MTDPSHDVPTEFPRVDPPPSGLPPPTGAGELYQGGIYRGPAARPAWPPPAPVPPPMAPPGPPPQRVVMMPYPQPTPVYVPVPPPRVVVRMPRQHHTRMHVLLSLFTCGLWLPVWLVVEFGGTAMAAISRMFRRR